MKTITAVYNYDIVFIIININKKIQTGGVS